MVTTLGRKLVRDLARLRGQAFTIAVVVACGIASYVTLESAYASLLSARDGYYASRRFADVFAHLERAPDALADRLAEIPGVAVAEPRLVETVMIPIEGLSEPATGRLVSLPPGGEPLLNAVALRDGRMVEAGRPDEAVVLESFARAHHLAPGSTIPVVLNGVLRSIRVVGTALSPEYVIAVAGGGGQEFAPDDLRFAVLFMDRDAVAPAFLMKGAFDDVSLRLQPGASEPRVIEEVDRVLAPYGGLGAVGRKRQMSHYFVTNELGQLESYATIAPLVFLGVAAFLVNVVLSRVVLLQRPQIATLKALGYGRRAIGAHYLGLVVAIVGLGSAFGVLLGAWLGRGMLGLYAPYFKFPELTLRIEPRLVVTSVAVSLATALAGALVVVARVVRLPPAEAMQPEAPPSYAPTWLERIGLGALVPSAGRMVMREVLRRPLRLALSCFGIALGIAVVVVGGFSEGALDVIIDVQFDVARREDVSVGFMKPVSGGALRELLHLPGVLAVEPQRVALVRLRAGHHGYETALFGHPRGADLARVVAWPLRVVDVPDEGALLTDALARRLDVAVGDVVTVEVLEGDRRSREVRVAGLAAEPFGLSAHMSLDALHALLGEEDVMSGALLVTDSTLGEALDRRLKAMPFVASVGRRADLVARFRKQSAESMRTTSLVLTLFGCAIAVGIVYNDARIALSVRSRDLASLRVLGFTRREISRVLLGELATYVVLAIPLGLVLGRGLTALMLSATDREIYRMPTIVTPGTYAFAVAVTLVAAIVSALFVRRQLDRLDLVAVLKARE